MRHKNRTIKGDQLIAKHQATYEKWWLGKLINTHSSLGIARCEKVEYIGNSVYGIVKITLSNGGEHYPHFTGFKPTKASVEVVEETK